MKLPPITDPARYAGLYVYDFGTHVSVGYTASEVRILRESRAYRDGTAYEIYRVTEQGGFELRGVLDERLGAREAMCFLYADGAKAKHDYDELRFAAESSPLPRPAEWHLARLRGFDPSDVIALLYDASSSALVANWLFGIGFAGGDRATGGIDVHAAFTGADGVRIESCKLPSLADYRDRRADEVLRTVNNPLQR